MSGWLWLLVYAQCVKYRYIYEILQHARMCAANERRAEKIDGELAQNFFSFIHSARLCIVYYFCDSLPLLKTPQTTDRQFGCLAAKNCQLIFLFPAA